MTSEAKIYIILSKEWKINRYGPWIFHRNIFTVVVQQVRPWSYHRVHHGAIMCLCRFLCQPCLGQSCFYPLREGTVRLTWKRGDD